MNMFVINCSSFYLNHVQTEQIIKYILKWVKCKSDLPSKEHKIYTGDRAMKG